MGVRCFFCIGKRSDIFFETLVAYLIRFACDMTLAWSSAVFVRITMPLFDGGQRYLAVNCHLVVSGHNDDRSGVQQASVGFSDSRGSNARKLMPL